MIDLKDYEELRAKCDFRHREVGGRLSDLLARVDDLEHKLELFEEYFGLGFKDGLHLVEK